MLKGGLTALEAREKARLEEEKTYEDGASSGDGGQEAEMIWKGVLDSMLTFLSPAVVEVQGSTAGVPSPKSQAVTSGFGNNDAVVDTALAVLSCAISTCPEKSMKELSATLVVAAKRCAKAAKWYSAEGQKENAEAELRVFSSCVMGLCGGVAGLKEGAREGMVDLFSFVAGRCVKSGRLLKKLGGDIRENDSGGLISRLASLSTRRESIEREVLSHGGSFGLDDDDDEEEESDGEGEAMRRAKAGSAHSFDCWVVNIACNELDSMWAEGGDNGELVGLLGEVCGMLVSVCCACDSTGLKEVCSVLIDRVDLAGIVAKAKRAEELERRVLELEAEVKTLTAQTWSLSGAF